MSDTKILTENTAAYSGQSNYTARLMRDGREAGHLDYVVYQGQPSVSYIEVQPSKRRQGVGRMLVQHLQSTFPDQEIDFGMLTEDGAALLAAITRKEPVPEVVAMVHELADIRRELALLDGRSEAFDTMSTHSDAELLAFRAWVGEVSDRWNALHDREYELDNALNRGAGLSEVRTMVVVEPAPSSEGPIEANESHRASVPRNC